MIALQTFLIPLTSAVVFMPAIVGCSQSIDGAKSEIVIADSDNGVRTNIALGSRFVIRLVTVPGTGFRWEISTNTVPGLKLMEEKTETPPKSLPGQNAFKTFRFDVTLEGKGTVELHYVRPWERVSTPAKMFRVNLEVSRHGKS